MTVPRPACGFRTLDPSVIIEEQHTEYVRYRHLVTGRRWEVLGVCAQRGSCMIGAAADDAGWLPRSERLDVPVTPELQCDPCTTIPLLRFREL